MKCQVDKSGLSNKSALPTDTTTGKEIDSLQKIHVFNMQKLKNSELRLAEAEQKIRELALTIKRKEDLIKELVRTGKWLLNNKSLFGQKLVNFADPNNSVKQRMNLSHILVTNFLVLKLKFDMNIQTLQKKQQDTKNLASLSKQSEREARELEQKVAQMKHQQSQIQKRLCEESEKKKQLEAELQQDQQQIKVGFFLFPCDKY
ncbi:KIF27 protein, partial [Cinclus mexicanus]|nr:KIF27 protein [Cinclus mexicanus]